jgi:hypothetical protein
MEGSRTAHAPDPPPTRPRQRARADRPTTVRPTCPELPVERVQHLAVDVADLDLADERTEVIADQRLVAVQGGRLDVQQLQVPIEELVDRRTGARIPPLVDLGEQPGACLLSLACCPRTGGNDLREMVRLRLTGSIPA